LVESDREAFRLAPDAATDLEAVVALRKAIEARQAARIPEGYRDSLPRAERLLSSASVSTLLEHIKTRGIAARPKPTTLRLA
jgi:hypothetical protein